MHIVTCPIDGRPCASDCPDRFIDREEGGCLLSMLAEQSDSVLYIGRNESFIEQKEEASWRGVNSQS